MGNHLVPARTDEFVANEIFNAFSFPALTSLQQYAIKLGKRHDDPAMGSALSNILWGLRPKNASHITLAQINDKRTGAEQASAYISAKKFEDVRKGVSYILISALDKITPEEINRNTLIVCRDFAFYVCKLYAYSPKSFKYANVEKLFSLPHPWLWETHYQKPHDLQGELAQRQLATFSEAAMCVLRKRVTSALERKIDKQKAFRASVAIFDNLPVSKADSFGKRLPPTVDLQLAVNKMQMRDWACVVDKLVEKFDSAVFGWEVDPAYQSRASVNAADKARDLLVTTLHGLHKRSFVQQHIR